MFFDIHRIHGILARMIGYFGHVFGMISFLDVLLQYFYEVVLEGNLFYVVFCVVQILHFCEINVIEKILDGFALKDSIFPEVIGCPMIYTLQRCSHDF